MNRAAVFTCVVTPATSRSQALNTPGTGSSCITTSNAVGTARIYMRQARRSYRHSLSVDFSVKQSRRAARAIARQAIIVPARPIRPDLSSGAGVRLLVHLLQPLDAGMRVYLGRGDRRVAEQLLHRAQIGAGVQQVSCEGVPQRVRRQA